MYILVIEERDILTAAILLAAFGVVFFYLAGRVLRSSLGGVVG